jgi:hypothetical protein
MEFRLFRGELCGIGQKFADRAPRNGVKAKRHREKFPFALIDFRIPVA